MLHLVVEQMEKMEKTLESVKGNFNTVRTGRANPSLLDRVEVRPPAPCRAPVHSPSLLALMLGRAIRCIPDCT